MKVNLLLVQHAARGEDSKLRPSMNIEPFNYMYRTFHSVVLHGVAILPLSINMDGMGDREGSGADGLPTR